MPCIRFLIELLTVLGLEVVLSEEVQPRRLLAVNARTKLVHIIEGREKCRRDVRQFVDKALVLYDRIGECTENTRLWDVLHPARLTHADGEVRKAVRLIVNGLAHLQRQMIFALHERHAVRDNGVLPI